MAQVFPSCGCNPAPYDVSLSLYMPTSAFHRSAFAAVLMVVMLFVQSVTTEVSFRAEARERPREMVPYRIEFA